MGWTDLTGIVVEGVTSSGIGLDVRWG